MLRYNLSEVHQSFSSVRNWKENVLKHNPIRFVVLITICLCLCRFPSGASAQIETGYDLIAAVNVLRASRGLEPYTTDQWIMDYAQQHSQYQADTKKSSHLHSDGTNSLSVGLRENVAGGDLGYVTIKIVVYQIWADPVHMNTMIGYKSGAAGAGVAVDDNDTVYYTLNVRPSRSTNQVTTTPGAPALTNIPAAPFIPIITNTPAPNGNIIHVVEYGETLWGIAVSYGVTMEAIRAANGLGSDETTIYVGQRLFIMKAEATTMPTQTQATMTSTNAPPTLTATPSLTPNPTPGDSPTHSSTQAVTKPSMSKNERDMFIWGIGLGVLVSGVAFGAVGLLKR